MNEQRVIIIGCFHYNTLGLIRSVGETGIKVDVIMEPCRAEGCYIRYSKYIRKISFLKSNEELLDVLHNDYEGLIPKPILLIGSDRSISVLDEHYEKLKEKFYLFNANGCIRHYMQKVNTFPLLKDCKIRPIKTWHVTCTADVTDDITYPCLIKGNDSTKNGKECMCVCTNKAELLKCVTTIGDYLVQEYIIRDFELDINGFSYDHGKKVFAPCYVHKIRDSFLTQSDYVRLDSAETYPTYIQDDIAKIVSRVGYEGIFSIELLVRGSDYYFLEINLRNDGLGYVYTLAGVNYPQLWIKYATKQLSDDDLKSVRPKTPLYVMRRTDFINVVQGRIGFWHWLQDLSRVDGCLEFSMKDVKPWVHLAPRWCRFLIVLIGENLLRRVGIRRPDKK